MEGEREGGEIKRGGERWREGERDGGRERERKGEKEREEGGEKGERISTEGEKKERRDVNLLCVKRGLTD